MKVFTFLDYADDGSMLAEMAELLFVSMEVKVMEVKVMKVKVMKVKVMEVKTLKFNWN